MSQRSILEINHDVTGQAYVDGHKLYDLLMQAVCSGSDRAWEPLKQFGIRRIVQCHHSDDCKILAHGREYEGIA